VLLLSEIRSQSVCHPQARSSNVKDRSSVLFRLWQTVNFNRLKKN